jgi:hypothetical protein
MTNPNLARNTATLRRDRALAWVKPALIAVCILIVGSQIIRVAAGTITFLTETAAATVERNAG